MRKATQSGAGGLYCVAAAASAESSAVDSRGHYLVTQLQL